MFNEFSRVGVLDKMRDVNILVKMGGNVKDRKGIRLEK